MSARKLSLAAALLALLSLGLPWVASRVQRSPSGPSCIADLSGEGGLICDYLGVADVSVVPSLPGTLSPARVLLVVALLLIVWSLLPRTAGTAGADDAADTAARTARLLAAVACLGAVALGLPAVLSGQVTALVAGALLLAAAGRGPQRVRSRRSATWGETAGSNPRPSAR